MEYQNVAPIMSLLWSPVAAVTSSWQGRYNAQIAVAIGGASIIPERPRVVVQIYKTNFTHELITNGRALALNFLATSQLPLIKTFGFTSGREGDKLAGEKYHIGKTGSPILDRCFAYLDCRVINSMDGGDMTCFLLEVVDGGTGIDAEPLWWSEARNAMPAEWLEQWNEKIQQEIKISLERVDNIEVTSLDDDWSLG